MTALVEELHFNNEDYSSIGIINVSVYIHPQVEIVLDDDNNNTGKKELSTEEKRKMYYIQRLEQISSIFK